MLLDFNYNLKLINNQPKWLVEVSVLPAKAEIYQHGRCQALVIIHINITYTDSFVTCLIMNLKVKIIAVKINVNSNSYVLN